MAALATAAAVVAAVAVAVVAIFFALFALVEPHVGRAGAGAVVAGAAALLAAIIAILAAKKMEGDRHRHDAAQAAAVGPGGSHVDMAHILLNVIKDRPLLSAGAAVAIGVYALRNPALISAVMRGFMDGRKP